jgi:copper homeostasis protein
MSEGEMLFEVCVDSVESAMAAERGGAHRVELCDNMLEGGTTPSAGAIEAARERLAIKVQVMIRPRGGDFLYSDVEFDVMRRDVLTAKRLGADGVVFGLLTPDAEIDVERTRELAELARPLGVTFHRAFDMSHDPFEALERLVESGVDRLLTSGQEPSVLEGLDLVAELVRRAGDRLIVMPGCGITERNVAKVVAATGAREVHVTGNAISESRMRYRNPRVFMGGALYPPEYARVVTDAGAVARLMARASGAGE